MGSVKKWRKKKIAKHKHRKRRRRDRWKRRHKK
ncbi:MAG: AURKAIP1/COX24 domain-containing protein [Anaerolineales bacterium]|nr:AURKAIP1/COX24 domain-containing protein [Anaerolineales bacterium]